MSTEAADKKKARDDDKRLNNLVAVTVVLLTVFMAITKTKDDNINQAMQKAKADAVDAWAEYQFARVKLHVDLCELLDFERDLNDGIGRAMRACGVDETDSRNLGRRYVEAAWRRIEEEWERERSAPDDCPMCQVPFHCPVGLG